MMMRRRTWRLGRSFSYYNRMAQDYELIFRRYLSATLIESLGSNKKIRGARRIESVIVAKDVCGLSDKQTNETLKWALEMILRGLPAE